ncbi:hypothetical protein DV738_g3022, partial [Chaetothyriales sp. CBS 135597]
MPSSELVERAQSRWHKFWIPLWQGRDSQDRHRWGYEATRLLPAHASDLPPSAFPAKEVTKIALRLKYQVEQVIPIELPEEKVTAANSPVITKQVIQCAKEAGGSEYGACVVYALLVCKRWFRRQALLELWDADLHHLRAIACERIAKFLIEDEENQDFLLQDVLLTRYSVLRHGEETEPANAIERAVDLHALHVIGSSGYQKCIKYLWKGWVEQDDENVGRFVPYHDRDNTSYWAHLNPDRMRTPLYQNSATIFVSLLYLALYTGAVNSINEDGDIDFVEGILYVMTFSFICDELTKFWKIGIYYLGFWNVFNCVLYALQTASFVIRMMALTASSNPDDPRRAELNKLGYHIFAFSAPMFWIRILLFLDTFRFFGAMLVILKVMMAESAIFFMLLIVICIGFLQAFIGLNQIEENTSITWFILQAMVNAVMGSPEFDGFDDYAYPFGLILYYIFTFIVMVVLLNVLIALYNSAYEDITGNATDEFMALFAQKTLQFARAPDENVFIPPLNLIEMFFLILPFEWWLSKEAYNRLNNIVMGIIYFPLLVLTAAYETWDAHRVRSNRRRGEEDDDSIEEWEQLEDELNFESEGWDKKVQSSKPDVQVDIDVVEIRSLKKDVDDLKQLVRAITPAAEGNSS